MITNLNNFVNESLGSSLALPANGLGGSRATSLLVAHFALQNTASNSAEKRIVPARAWRKGGLGGIPPRPSEYKKRTAPPSCSLRAEPRTKVFFRSEERRVGKECR